MGVAPRDKLNDSFSPKGSPGPGTYEPKSYLGEGPKVSIKQRVNNNVAKSLTIPGPGAYEPKLEAVARKYPDIGIGYGKRDDAISSNSGANIPGPGYYPLNELGTGPKYGFGTGKRQLSKLDDVPGPGHYEIPSRIGDGDLPPHERSKHY